jgi:hypothetical protein
MPGFFQNINPPPLVRVEDLLAGWRGVWGANILEDARHSSVLYVCMYFVGESEREGGCCRKTWLQSAATGEEETLEVHCGSKRGRQNVVVN